MNCIIKIFIEWQCTIIKYEINADLKDVVWLKMVAIIWLMVLRAGV